MHRGYESQKESFKNSNRCKHLIKKDSCKTILIFIPFASYIFLALLIITIISCTALEPNKGTVVLDIDPGYQINTALPDIDMKPVRYDFHGRGPNRNSFDVSDDQLPVYQKGLDFGEWTITVNAKNADDIIIAQGVLTTSIHSGNAVTLLIPVRPITGYGVLDVTVLWNETEVEIPSLHGQIITSSGIPIDIDFILQNAGKASFVDNNIPTGYYTVNVQLFNSDVHVAGAVEVVRIVDNQITSSVLEFFDINQSSDQDALPYPRLAMWWPDSWDPDLDMLERYDYIGWGVWENKATLENLKRLNPDQLHFMSVNLTEVRWDDWGNYPVMKQIPAEWFLTQVGSVLTEHINETQTYISLVDTTDSYGEPLFEQNDTVVCGNESMKVIAVNHGTATLTVERGFVRLPSSHAAGERVAAHISFWPETWVMNMSTLCPEHDAGNGPERWVDWAIRNDMRDDMMDGFILDRLEGDQSWLVGSYARNIDPDCTNRFVDDDYEAFDLAWKEDIQEMLLKLRALIKDKPLIANARGTYQEALNGSIYESCPGNWSIHLPETYEEWVDDVLGVEGYINVSKDGHSPNYSLIETYEIDAGYFSHNPMDDPGFVPNYQRMRFGLSTALLGDGYFSYEIGTAGHGSLGLLWFDEYDNADQERGYLGYPISDAFVIQDYGSNGKVFQRNFDNGIVICNPSERDAQIDLDGAYKLLDGTQQPDINTGEWISTILIEPKDGRILSY